MVSAINTYTLEQFQSDTENGRDVSQKESLDAGNRQLTTLPSNTMKLTALTDLLLTNNDFTQVPSELAHLDGLKILRLNFNALKTLEYPLFTLTALQTLNLGFNELNAIPPEIQSLCNLTTLILAENQISELPRELKNLTKLQTLDLVGNKLRKLPYSLSEIKSIKHLKVDDNPLDHPTTTPSPEVPSLKQLALTASLKHDSTEKSQLLEQAHLPSCDRCKQPIEGVVYRQVIKKYLENTDTAQAVPLEMLLDSQCAFPQKIDESNPEDVK